MRPWIITSPTSRLLAVWSTSERIDESLRGDVRHVVRFAGRATLLEDAVARRSIRPGVRDIGVGAADKHAASLSHRQIQQPTR